MKWYSVLRLVVLTCLVVPALSIVPAQAGSTTSGQWMVQYPQNTAANYDDLEGVAAISTSDVWAVGSYRSKTNANLYLTLIEHYNGTGWSIVPSPNQGSGSNELIAASATGPADVWAVGYYFDPSTTSHVLIEHWNGTAWSIVPSADLGATNSGLTGIHAISPSDAWAVGGYGSSPGNTLIEHWNGSAWSRVSSPNRAGGNNGLASVSAVSSSDVWAVGHSAAQTLIEHWNGTAWAIVPSPNMATNTYLRDVAAISSSNVWAVGYGSTPSVPGDQPVSEHWNGASWSLIPTSNPPIMGELDSVTAISSSDVWAVGSGNKTSGSTTMSGSLMQHWNGSTWTVVPSPDSIPDGITTRESMVRAVAATGSTMSAVGYYFGPSNGSVLTAAWRWQPVTAGPHWSIGSTGTDKNGHHYVNVDLTDPTGILAVSGTRAMNCTLAITKANNAPFGPQDITPSGMVGRLYTFSSPYPSPVEVTVTTIDNTKGCAAAGAATDPAFSTTFIDPVVTQMSVGLGTPFVQTEQIPQEENWVTIQNMTPGLSQVTFVVNGYVFLVQGLHDGEQRVIDLSRALHAGMNTVQMVCLGRVGASAAILFSN